MKLIMESAVWRQKTAAFALFALLSPLALVSPAFADDKKKNPDEIGNRKVDGKVNFYSIEKEIALGKQMAQEVERQAKIVDDPVVAEYVNRIGQNLVRNSDAKVPFTIKVIDAEDINAFALPGGFFFVNTGVLLNAANEAEMAGVMAHEIAHVAAPRTKSFPSPSATPSIRHADNWKIMCARSAATSKSTNHCLMPA